MYGTFTYELLDFVNGNVLDVLQSVLVVVSDGRPDDILHKQFSQKYPGKEYIDANEGPLHLRRG